MPRRRDARKPRKFRKPRPKLRCGPIDVRYLTIDDYLELGEAAKAKRRRNAVNTPLSTSSTLITGYVDPAKRAA